jgi:hypothetical protein
MQVSDRIIVAAVTNLHQMKSLPHAPPSRHTIGSWDSRGHANFEIGSHREVHAGKFVTHAVSITFLGRALDRTAI